MEKLVAAEALVAQADKYGEDGWDRAERYAAERDAARAALDLYIRGRHNRAVFGWC